MVAIAAVVGVILYRISVNAALLLSHDKTITTFAGIITSTTAALLNLVCIMIFNQVNIVHNSLKMSVYGILLN